MVMVREFIYVSSLGNAILFIENISYAKAVEVVYVRRTRYETKTKHMHLKVIIKNIFFNKRSQKDLHTHIIVVMKLCLSDRKK